MINNDNLPRVLVVSHNAFSDTKSNGKTLVSFFGKWPKKKLAQFFIYKEIPDSAVCENYFRITDHQILSSFLREVLFSSKQEALNIGEIITDTKMQSHLLMPKENKGRFTNFINRLMKNRFSFAIIIRDILWTIGLWKNSKFLNWLDSYNPQVLFFQSSNCVFPYKIVKWIQMRYNIPIITQITDDYVTLGFSLNLLKIFHHKWLMNNFLDVLRNSFKIIAISDYMASEYKNRFGGTYEVLMNSTRIDSSLEVQRFTPTGKYGFNFIYAGNLGLHRWKVIALLGQCLNELNKMGQRNTFQIYSSVTPDSHIRDILNISSEIRFYGSLNKKELEQALSQADVLVHVEAFDKKNQKITRLSISTKIPEYMAAKKCIFAIGPSDIAPIRYLLDNNIAVVCTQLDKNAIKALIINMLNGNTNMSDLSDNAFKLATLNHDIIKTQDKIKHILKEPIYFKEPLKKSRADCPSTL